MASAEGKRTERFSEKSLNLENSLNLRFGFPRVKRHFSYESNEQELNDFQRNPLDIEILANLRFGSLEIRDTSVTRVTNNF